MFAYSFGVTFYLRFFFLFHPKTFVNPNVSESKKKPAAIKSGLFQKNNKRESIASIPVILVVVAGGGVVGSVTYAIPCEVPALATKRPLFQSCKFDDVTEVSVTGMLVTPVSYTHLDVYKSQVHATAIHYPLYREGNKHRINSRPRNVPDLSLIHI